ncbi:STN domain-containing protein [Peristeroidobacter soli]|uniref:STN domain-containing protein n=1 Tax=Peristeroidobacter soli TaxID=2497877 RepID=UPI00101CE371|nr:STN domain-containing protein [Peristeroidobacter soli]
MFAGLRRLGVVCGLVTVLSIPAHAQQSAAQVERTFRFNIPSKPLLAALVDFTDVTGVQLLYPSTGELKVTSRAVSGTYSAQEALRQMLQGTGIGFRFANHNTVTLQKESEQGTRTLGPVRVEGADRCG